MNQFTADPQDSETASHSLRTRLAELARQNWGRNKSQALARNEDLNLSDEHWAVIVFLRRFYLEQGLPSSARATALALNRNFFGQGGNKYLRCLFAGGPVSQGSRLANLRTPANATDASSGTSY